MTVSEKKINAEAQRHRAKSKGKPILIAENIHKSFDHPQKVTILQGVNLSISPTETIAIVGPSGSGKSTLLHILGTLEEPTSGTLYFQGEPLKENQLSQIRSEEIGFVFQQGNLLEDYTLLDNLLIKAKIARKRTHKNSPSYKHACELLERVDLIHRKDFFIKYLSGGERQRASIARALMNDPSLILADEPTGNLDTANAKKVQDLLIACCKEFKKSLIVVTHDKQFANLTDRVFELRGGVLIEDHS